MMPANQLRAASRLMRAVVLTGLVFAWSGTSVSATDESLPARAGPAVIATSGVPHVQLNQEAVPAVREVLMGLVAQVPDLELRPTVVSMPGATGFWLSDHIALDRPDVIAGGREFAHIHPDGSLHASLPPPLAREAVAKGWGARHPWAHLRPGWDGFIMIFTPRTEAEAHIVFRLVLDGYNFVTGRDLRAADYSKG